LALSIHSKIEEYILSISDIMRQFRVRIGLAENVDNLITDINHRTNVAGAGVNLAARVMDLADGGQILVSQNVHEMLSHREKYLSAFRSYESTIKHGSRLRVYQFVKEGHQGLNIECPSTFSTPASSKPVLTELEAWYFAHAIKNKQFLLSKSQGGQTRVASIVLLWFLASDSVGVAHQHPAEPYSFTIHGDGKLPIDDIFKYYMNVEFWIICELAGFISNKLSHLSEYFDSPFLMHMINDAGAAKLKTEHPAITLNI
jgi:hypothetical protein